MEEAKKEAKKEAQVNYTELLEKEYGQDEIAQQLIQEYRTEMKMSDEKIYKFLESFY